MNNRKKRILLFIHLVTVAQKTLNGVLERYPNAKITLLVRYDARRDHIENNPNIESFILYKNVALNPFDLIKGRFDFIKQISVKTFDVIVIPDKRLKSCFLNLFGKADEKLIYDVDKDCWFKFGIFDIVKALLVGCFATVFGPIFFILLLIVILLWGGGRTFKKVVAQK
jgi:hypothetical protein